MQRTISADIRYVLWAIDKWGKADNILKGAHYRPISKDREPITLKTHRGVYDIGIAMGFLPPSYAYTDHEHTSTTQST